MPDATAVILHLLTVHDLINWIAYLLPDEMQVCGETVTWDEADLVAAIRPGYGYSEDSAQIMWLREVLLEMPQLEQHLDLKNRLTATNLLRLLVYHGNPILGDRAIWR